MILCGLVNIQNTCALNTFVQCFGNIIKEKLDQFPSDKDKYPKTTNLLELVNLMKANKNKVIRPNKFVIEFFKDSSFKPGQQHDVSEIWIYIIDKIHEELSIPAPFTSDIGAQTINKIFQDKTSIIKEYLMGSTLFTQVCTACDAIKKTYEPFSLYYINVASSIMEGLCNTFIQDDEEHYCEKCNNKTKQKKYIQLVQVPEYLMVSIKRFDNNMRKLQDPILINKALSFKTRSLNGNIVEENKYKLLATACHHGSYGGGHYTTMLYDGPKSYSIDDTNISKQETPSTINSTNAYIVVYQKI